jgi:hypothetical protein
LVDDAETGLFEDIDLNSKDANVDLQEHECTPNECSECVVKENQIESLQQKVILLERRLQKATFSIALLKNNDSNVRFFTGLPCWKLFVYVSEFVSPNASTYFSLH